MSVFKKGGDFNYIKFDHCPLEYGNRYLQQRRLPALVNNYSFVVNRDSYNFHKFVNSRYYLTQQRYLCCFLRINTFLKNDISQYPNKSININGKDFSATEKKEILKEIKAFAERNLIQLTLKNYDKVNKDIAYQMIYS